MLVEPPRSLRTGLFVEQQQQQLEVTLQSSPGGSGNFFYAGQLGVHLRLSGESTENRQVIHLWALRLHTFAIPLVTPTAANGASLEIIFHHNSSPVVVVAVVSVLVCFPCPKEMEIKLEERKQFIIISEGLEDYH